MKNKNYISRKKTKIRGGSTAYKSATSATVTAAASAASAASAAAAPPILKGNKQFKQHQNTIILETYFKSTDLS